MPNYPGLERWRLIEKIGDGAFSTVYRASDTRAEFNEVAVKVIRKYEMNDNQVSRSMLLKILPSNRVTETKIEQGGRDCRETQSRECGSTHRFLRDTPI
jgi:serine/threonine protein kinase